jgi:hypothetical protein
MVFGRTHNHVYIDPEAVLRSSVPGVHSVKKLSHTHVVYVSRRERGVGTSEVLRVPKVIGDDGHDYREQNLKTTTIMSPDSTQHYCLVWKCHVLTVWTLDVEHARPALRPDKHER